jgi:Icc-related predicted phosphoesterase
VGDNALKIISISDTHTCHDEINIPAGDILIHSGDFSSIGREKEVIDFIDWFQKQSHKYKIFIAGNHDKCFDTKFNDSSFNLTKPNWLQDILNNLKNNTFYLEDSLIEIEGINIYGSPWTPWFHGDYWAFNKHKSDITDIWNKIPKETDILITHGPPYGILDYIPSQRKRVGCDQLINRIRSSNIKLHFFGHIHESYGKFVDYENRTFVNSCILNEFYDVINKPIIIDYNK